MQRPYRSLYVHVPFCRRKCGYCAFYSLPEAPPDLQERYLDRLAEDCEALGGSCAPLRSVFLGGGTPSALGLENLRRLGALVGRNFRREPDCEWTCEANPESLTPEKIACLREAGVNRFSLGIQSFQPELRRRIGRRGSLDRLEDILESLAAAGLDNYSFDLIYDVPGETPGEWAADLAAAAALRPAHLSAYSLILEDGTPLARSAPPRNSEDAFLGFWRQADRILGGSGFRRYEISNFCRDGRRCRHNDDVWHGGTYLGLGPAAVSFDGRDRSSQPPDLRLWLERTPPEVDSIPEERRAAEILAFGMRTLEGWTWDRFRETTGFEALELRPREIRRLARLGLVDLAPDGMAPTEQGLLCNDDLLEELL